MAFAANSPHQFAFTATSGLTGFAIDIFTKDGDAVTDVDVLASFSVLEPSAGHYLAQYTPKISGFYFIGISHSSVAIATDAADIDAAGFFNLTQNTGGLGALKPTLPTTHGVNQFSKLEEYLLFVIASSDWDVGRKTPNYAHASTSLLPSGDWETQPLVVLPGTYHIVIQNNFGVQRVIAAYLVVGNPED